LLHQLSHQLQVIELVQQNKNLIMQKNELENENAQFRVSWDVLILGPTL